MIVKTLEALANLILRQEEDPDKTRKKINPHVRTILMNAYEV